MKRMRLKASYFVRLLTLIGAVSTTGGAASANSPDTFVHLFEWSWDNIAHECQTFLGPKGFSAVQISPPDEHIRGTEWWTRYQPVSYRFSAAAVMKKLFGAWSKPAMRRA